MKKIVLKVIIMCSKCKVCIMKAIAKICGIISISLDVEKCTVTIIGEVDAAVIVEELRKAGKTAEINSVGPHKKVEKKKECCKKECCKKECCKKECCEKECKPLPACCNTCRPHPYGHILWHEDSSVCPIL